MALRAVAVAAGGSVAIGLNTPALVDWHGWTTLGNFASIGVVFIALSAAAATLRTLERRVWWFLESSLPTLATSCLALPLAWGVFSPAERYSWPRVLVVLSTLVIVAGILQVAVAAVGQRFGVTRVAWILLWASLIFPFWRSLGIGLPRSPEGSASQMTVALLVGDTVRASYLVDGKTHTPALNALKNRGVWTASAQAASSWTVPSHSVLLSGSDFYLGTETRIDDRTTTVAERYQQAGYLTIGVVANPTLHPDNGFAQGFDLYWSVQGDQPAQYSYLGALYGALAQRERPLTFVKGHAINDIVTRLLERYADAPVFVFVNYMDAHDPYLPTASAISLYPQLRNVDRNEGFIRQSGASYAEFMRSSHELSESEKQIHRDLYRACLTDWDRAVGELVSAIDERAGRSLVVVTSDHGELFDEHGGFFLHKTQLWNGELEVPLLVAGSALHESEHGIHLPGLVAHRHMGAFLALAATRRIGSVVERFDDIINAEGNELQIAISVMGPTEIFEGVADERAEHAAEKLLRIIAPEVGAEVLLIADKPAMWRAGPVNQDERKDLIERFSETVERYRRLSPVWSAGNDTLTEQELEAMRSLGYIQ